MNKDINIRAYFFANTPREIKHIMLKAANGFIDKGINTMSQLCGTNLDDLIGVPDINDETKKLILLLCEKYIAKHDGDAEGCDNS